MNTSINFEVAKLLKEKGFDLNPYLEIDDENPKNLNSNYNPKEYQPWYFNLIISEVVMWFYEKYNIWISVDVDINGRFRNMLRKYNNNEGVWEIIKTFFIDEYDDSPTEAYLNGIEYTLKNLV